MNNEVSQRHKRRWADGSNNEKESSLNEAIENFNSIVDNLENPTVHTIQYTLPKEVDVNNRLTTNVIISDVTRNDDVFDAKLLHTKLDSGLNSGSYVWWSGEVYIVSNEETNAVESHRTYMISRCANYVNIRYKGKVYYYPIAISNLTLYGDGLAENVDITTLDGKRSIMISNNEVTQNIDVNHRIIISKKTVFRVSMIDDFTNEGLFSMTLVQTVFNSKDDRENKIAYNENFSDKNITKIIGEDYIYLGAESTYQCNKAIDWNVSNNSITLTILDTVDSCKIKCNTDENLIGTTFELSAFVNNLEYKKKIMIRGLF